MKHRICSLRATLAAALVLVILFVPALAAEITVDYTSEYRFSAADFSSSDGLEGIYISSVPPAYQAELCIGSRVIRRHEDRLRLVEIPPEELYDCDTKRALDELKTQTGEP